MTAPREDPRRKLCIIAKFICTASILSILIFCHSPAPVPSDMATEFSSWFINPSATKLDSLLSCSCTPGQWDSIVTAAINSATPATGSSSVILKDTFNQDFTLGYLTPPKIQNDTLFPLIVYLHGGIGTTRNDKGKEAYEMLRPLADSLTLYLASPSGNRNAPWWAPNGLSRILQTVRYMTLHFPINPDKIFLAGVSDGATGCYAAANTICRPFAGFIAISGYGGLLRKMGVPLIPANLMQRPIYNINAGKDHLYPPQAVTQFLAWLKENNVTVKNSFYPDEKHGFDYREKEYGNLVTIIRTWSRPDNRKGVSWNFIPPIPSAPDNIFSWSYTSPKSDFLPSVSGFWKNDTLLMHAQGLSTITICSDKTNSSENLIYRLQNGKIKKTSSTPLTPELYLKYLLYKNNPVNDIKEKRFYTLDLN
ncbi:MAG: hypothetical protein GF401_08465 [Chitinivibrionales bacterium]|nr:hypothetical protein [Chitinivibrionales bacterium]